MPICEVVISCDNLLCDGHGRPPNPTVIVQISEPNRLSWIRYGRTEVIEVMYFPEFGICFFSFNFLLYFEKKAGCVLEKLFSLIFWIFFILVKISSKSLKSHKTWIQIISSVFPEMLESAILMYSLISFI